MDKIHVKNYGRWFAATATMMLVMLMVSATVAAQSASGLKYRNGASLTVTFLNQDPDPVEPGSYVDLRWKVENLGTEDLKTVNFRLDLQPPFSLDNPNESEKQLGDVGTKQVGEDAIILHWRVRVDPAALEGNNQVRLNYFIDDVGIKLSPFTVNIKNKQVLLGIDRITVEPDHPVPGQLVNVSITLHNSVDTYVQDIKVKLDLTATDIAAIGSTNERVIDRISPGEAVTIPFTLAVDPSAVSKIHQIPLSVNYGNRFGDEFLLNTSFGVMVGAGSDYLVNLEKTEVYTPDSKGKITISVSNIGKSNLNFVALELLPSTKYNLLSAGQVYLGNLESDDFETGEFTIYVPDTKAKSVDLQVKIRYKDAYNTVEEKQAILPLQLYSNSEAKRMGLVTSSGRGWLVLLAVLIVAAIIEWRRGWKEIMALRRRKTSPSHEPEQRRR